ncbi:CHASE2 domain-containing protein [Sulfurimonas sp. NWX79]|uniref:CHASE2 domain-containing protein n=1 Tax=Sulfurimonas sp. NWX79 TaxID=2925412 RepID=UPI00248460D4|nr:CHASE2 domain-containing protein [Sulfurimonas indica]
MFANHYFLFKSDFVKFTDYKIYDALSSSVYEKSHLLKKSHVLVVDIDERSLRALGQWPWPRVIMAELVSKIDSLNAAAIGLDIIFPEKDRTSPLEIVKFYQNFFGIEKIMQNLPQALQNNDTIFASVLEHTASTMSLYLSNDYLVNEQCQGLNSIAIDTQGLELQRYKYALCNMPLLHSSAKYQGFVNSTIDEDGVLRRVSLFKEYKNTIIPNFALALLLNTDSDLQQEESTKFNILGATVQTDKETNILLNIYDKSWYKKVSAIDILNDTVPLEMIRGKIVIVGSSAVGLHDQVVIKDGKKIIGSKVHVTMIDNILNREYFIQLEHYKIVNILLSLFVTLLLFFLLITNKNSFILFLFFATLLLAFAATYYCIAQGIYISIAYFLLPFLIHFFIVSFLYIFIDAYERHVLTQELNRSHVALLDSMVHVAEVHDIETGAHIVRTKKYIKVLAEHIYSKGFYARELSPEKIDMMYATAPLHDLGKVGIEDAILKKEGKLTPMEYEVMKTHTDLGRHIINNAISSYKENDFFIMARNIAHYHHEKWDGTGYPKGLKGEEIPLESRFMALADVYDALVSRRVYKEAFTFEETSKIIIEGRAKHFDPILVDGFVEIEVIFREIAQKYSDDTVES